MKHLLITISVVAACSKSHAIVDFTDANVITDASVNTDPIADTTIPHPDVAPDTSLPPIRFSQVTVSEDRTCALGTDSHVYCWGLDLLAPEKVSTKPTAVPGLSGVSEIKMHQDYACAVVESSLTLEPGVYCWGKTPQTHLSFPQRTPIFPYKLLGSSEFHDLALAEGRVCAIREGIPSCWGVAFDPGGCWPPFIPHVSGAPVQFVFVERVEHVSTSGGITCLLGDLYRVAQTAICNNGVFPRTIEFPIRTYEVHVGGCSDPHELRFDIVQTSGAVTRIDTFEGGAAQEFQLHDGVPSALSFFDINQWPEGSDVGYQYCIETTDGSLYCKTYSTVNGTTVPSEFTEPNLTNIAASGTHICGLRDGRVLCRGSNIRGALGSHTF